MVFFGGGGGKLFLIALNFFFKTQFLRTFAFFWGGGGGKEILIALNFVLNITLVFYIRFY